LALQDLRRNLIAITSVMRERTLRGPQRIDGEISIFSVNQL